MTPTSPASRRSWLSAGLAILALAAGGCVVIPTNQPVRDIPPEQREALRLGDTRRADILMRYGEPELRIDGDRVLVYRWSRLRAVVVVIALAAIAGFPVEDAEAIFLEFGADGGLARFGMATAWKTDDLEEQARAWSRGSSLVPASR